MAETRTPMTADELVAVPDDGWQYELVRGELIKMAPAFQNHGAREGEAFYHLSHFVRQHHPRRVFPGQLFGIR